MKNNKTVHDDKYKKTIDYLKKIRKENSITQKEMAKHLNLRQADLSKIENYDRRLDLQEALNWIAICGDCKPRKMLKNLIRIYFNIEIPKD
jgi:transcriptional regulator with XRE-family HTH domain